MPDKRYNAGYEIIQCKRVGNKEFLLGQNLKFPSQYVTWKNNVGELSPYWGHYFSDKKAAVRDLNRRVRDERGFER